ncbi:MAG: anion permease [Clostridia bacterium]|nr:anion permease [Clostridia bacterium]
MDVRMMVTLAVFLFMIVSFSLHKLPMALTSVIGLLALVVTGCVDSKTALSNMGSSTVITMISMFVIAAGLGRTQMVEKLSKLVYRVSKGSFTKVLAGYVLATFILGQFIPSITALFALVCPLVIAMCEEMKISPSKMMYSIGLVAVATAYTVMPIGPYAATFIEDNGYLLEYGITDYRFTAFTQMNIKIFVAAFVILWAIFFAPRFAPDRPVVPISMVEARQKARKEPLSPFREVVGYVVFFGVILCLICQSFGLPSWIIPACGAAFLVLTGVLSEKEAIGSMCLDIVLLYVGVVTLGSAFANTGAGELVGDAVAGLLGGVQNSYLIGAVFFLAAFVMTSLLYNRAVSKILIPLVILTSMSLKCDPRGLMEMCYIGSMCSVMTPMATSVVPMMMGAGGYDQKALVKMGWLPALLMGVITVLVGMTMYPCF